MPLSNPHNHHINSQLEPGAVVVVKGVSQEDGEKRITVNLSQSSNGYDAANIVFQLNIRFDSDEIVMNSKQGGEWGKEQKVKNVVKVGDDVDIRIVCRSDKLVIMCQRKELTTYEHRLPLGSVTDVFVAGSLGIKGVACGGRQLSMPYSGTITEYNRGDLLYISGETAKAVKRLYINFYNRNGDAVLHFNPRFDTNEVVRNAKIGGEYGAEEKEGEMPFGKDAVFDLAVLNGSGSFTIYANDREFCKFEHRSRDSEVVKVTIEGELDHLHSVDVLRG